MKFAILSHVLPPSRSGQAMVLYRLLKELDPTTYCLISDKDYGNTSVGNGYSGKVAGTYYRCARLQSVRASRFAATQAPKEASAPSRSLVGEAYRLRALALGSGGRLRSHLAKARGLLNTALSPVTIAVRSRQIARIVEQEQCDLVIACSGDLANLPAGYLASRMTKTRFCPYLFDYYSYAPLDPITRAYARVIERKVIKGASNVIVPNEFLGEELRRRHGVGATVLHNPCDTSNYLDRLVETPREPCGEVKIVYTGAVYRAHYDAFHNLLAAIAALGRPDIRLHIYTAQARNDLEQKGIRGPVVFHRHRPLSEMPVLHQDADMLFLPLAFNSPYPDIVRTSAPGKMGEYLAAGRPIIVHAPPDSYVSWYFGRNECGLVVDQDDPHHLARAIRAAMHDADLRQRVSMRARRQAILDFDLAQVRLKFADLVGLDRPLERGSVPDKDPISRHRTTANQQPVNDHES